MNLVLKCDRNTQAPRIEKSYCLSKMDVDRYERTVARCFLKDGREVNAVMIASGTAVEYHRFSKGFYANQSD